MSDLILAVGRYRMRDGGDALLERREEDDGFILWRGRVLSSRRPETWNAAGRVLDGEPPADHPHDLLHRVENDEPSDDEFDWGDGEG